MWVGFELVNAYSGTRPSSVFRIGAIPGTSPT